MASLSHFILLYFISQNIIYVHYPPNVTRCEICFSNKTNITLDKNCQFMKVGLINNNTISFMYHINKGENASRFFKVLYHYSNQTIFDTNWIERSELKYTHFQNESFNYTKFINEKNNGYNTFNIVNLFLTFTIFLYITILIIFFYYKFQTGNLYFQ